MNMISALGIRRYLPFLYFTLSMFAVNIAHAQWSIIDSSSVILGNQIDVICSDPSGNLYATGLFTNYNSYNYVAKWDGHSWSEIGGLSALTATGEITALCIDVNGNIYAGCQFNSSAYDYSVAKWDGHSWSRIGGSGGGQYQVTSLCADTLGNVYAILYNPSTGLDYGVEKWDGNSWTYLGMPGFTNGTPLKAIYSDPAGHVYVGGSYMDSSLTYAVLKWDGNAWSELGGNNSLAANGVINTICGDGAGNVYVGGNFTDSSIGTGTTYVAKWNGSAWSRLSIYNVTNPPPGISQLCSDPFGNLYASGYYTMDTSYNQHLYVAKWDGSQWSRLGGNNSMETSNNLNGMAICTDSWGDVFASGTYIDTPFFSDEVAEYMPFPHTYTHIDTSLCQGYTIHVGNNAYSTTGNYTDTLIGTGGIDSIVTLRLTINPLSHVDLYDSICNGSTYIFGGHILTAVGIYNDTLASIWRCDSIVSLHLSHKVDSANAHFSIQPTSTSHVWDIQNQCTGTGPLSYVWSWGDASNVSTGDTPSHTYDSAGYYTICVTAMTSSGCSSQYCDTNVYLFKDQSSPMIQVRVFNQLPSGLISVSDNALISVYPNPTNGPFTIESSDQKGVEYTITDMLSNILVSDVIKSDMQVVHLNAVTGVYILKITGQLPFKVVLDSH